MPSPGGRASVPEARRPAVPAIKAWRRTIGRTGPTTRYRPGKHLLPVIQNERAAP